MQIIYTLFFLATVLLVSGVSRSEPVTDTHIRYSTVIGHGGVPLNVVENGNPENPSILFVHGFSQSQLSFKHQLKSKLATKYHLVSFDLRGHGASGKPWDKADYSETKIWADDLAQVIEATGLDRPVIVGWSFGGYVVMDYVRHYGTEDISGINLVGTLAGLVKPGTGASTYTEATRLFIAKVMEISQRSKSLNSYENIQASQDNAKNLSTPNMTPKELDVAFAMQLMMPAYVRSAMDGRPYNNLDLLKGINTPFLLSRGSDDFYMNQQATQVLTNSLANARVSIYEGSGHLPFFDQSERFNQELDQFSSSLNVE